MFYQRPNFLLFQDHEVFSKVRTNSAIHIKVYKKSMSEITSTSKGASKEVS